LQAFLLPVLAPRWGEQRLLLLGLILSCVEQSLLAAATTKAQALGAISLGALAGVAYPAISAIKANMCGVDQQGLVQGALAGIRALASGLGPLAFAQVFSMTTRTGSEFGYHPSAVLWASCGMTAVAVLVAATVPSDAGRSPPAVVYRAVRSAASGEDVEGCSSTAAAPEGAGEVYQAPPFQASAINVKVVGEVGKERVNSILVRDVNLDAVQREYSLPVKRRDSD
jgi:MFS family permease